MENNEIKEEIKKYFKTNENVSTAFQYQWDASKAILRGKLIVKKVFLMNFKTAQISNLTFYLKELEKEGQTKPKGSRREEIIINIEEINKWTPK